MHKRNVINTVQNLHTDCRQQRVFYTVQRMLWTFDAVFVLVMCRLLAHIICISY